MIMKTENVTWIPPVGEAWDMPHGWLDLGGPNNIWTIISLHHYADYGMSMETFTIKRDGETKEIYSYDEGETFTFDCW